MGETANAPFLTRHGLRGPSSKSRGSPLTAGRFSCVTGRAVDLQRSDRPVHHRSSRNELSSPSRPAYVPPDQLGEELGAWAALTSRVHAFQPEVLAQEANLAALAAINRESDSQGWKRYSARGGSCSIWIAPRSTSMGSKNRAPKRGLSDMKRPVRAMRMTRRDLFQTSAVVAGAAAVARWGGALAFPRMAEAQAPYFQSSNNIVFVDKCRSLQNLTLSLQATRNLITLGNNGFSLQLNCYPQTHPQATYRNKPLIWMQYVIAVQNNSILWGIQYFSAVKGFGFSPSPNYVSFASAPSNRVPAGSVMKIALGTKANGNVTKVKFSIQRVPSAAAYRSQGKGFQPHVHVPV